MALGEDSVGSPARRRCGCGLTVLGSGAASKVRVPVPVLKAFGLWYPKQASLPPPGVLSPRCEAFRGRRGCSRGGWLQPSRPNASPLLSPRIWPWDEEEASPTEEAEGEGRWGQEQMRPGGGAVRREGEGNTEVYQPETEGGVLDRAEGVLHTQMRGQWERGGS